MLAWLGLGANLQDPVEQINRALYRLDHSTGITRIQTSSFYRTPPWGDQQQDDFINAVTQVETSLGPLPLLHTLQSIENDMGRIREGRRWGPRVIDIDLLLFGEQTCQSAELELPHPRMHQRAFVLLPLFELAPSLEIPGRGVLGELLSQLSCNGIQRLEDTGAD